MMICPRCQTEYRDGFTVCAKCHTPLIKLESDQKPWQEKTKLTAMEPVLLFVPQNRWEEESKCGLLEEAGIPFLVQDEGCGNWAKIYMNFSAFGSAVYVDRQDLPQAQALLAALPPPAIAKETEPTAVKPRKWTAKRVFAVFLILFFLLDLFIALLSAGGARWLF